ncbi:MAG: hypothetical protein ACI9MR_001458 [Myxococcota bacterium]|jgi:hypothetical protein
MKLLAHVLLILATIAVGLPSQAQGLPPELSYRGALSHDDGTPFVGDVALQVALYDSVDATVPVWGPVLFDPMPVIDGHFDLVLGAGSQPSLTDAMAAEAAFVEVTVDDFTLAPRQALLAMPYAFRAADADRLEGMTIGELSAGLKGDTGPTGPQGEPGPKGDIGQRGDPGPKGDPGDTGSQGMAGPKGDDGDTGSQGMAGPKGDDGDTGSQGMAGPKGDTGDTGSQGPVGPVGPATVVSVLDFIDPALHGLIASGGQIDDVQAAIITAGVQAAVDAAPDGSVIRFPAGTYRLMPTEATGNDVVMAQTQTLFDNPDNVAILVAQRRGLVFDGRGARILHPRGYAFYTILSEDIHYQGFDIAIESYNLVSGFEPSAIVYLYSFGGSVEGVTTHRQHRAIFLQRSTGITVRGCTILENHYAGIGNYGEFYNPGLIINGQPFNPATLFSVPVTATGPGTLITGNTVRLFATYGIYSNGPAVITQNRVSHHMAPADTTAHTFIHIASRGDSNIITANTLFNASLTLVNDSSATAAFVTGILVDIENAAGFARRVRIADNIIDGVTHGVSIGEADGLIISGNVIRNYSVSAIMAIADERIDTAIKNVLVTMNAIQNVSPGTRRGLSTYSSRGALVFLQGKAGGRSTVDGIMITRNQLDFRVGDIVDDDVRQIFSDRAINLNFTGNLNFEDNLFSDDCGGISTHDNLAAVTVGRTVDGVPQIVTAAQTDIASGPSDVWLTYLGTSDATVTLPARSHIGQRFTILNRSNFTLRVRPHGLGYVMSGSGGAVVLDNTAHAKARSAVTLFTRSGSRTSVAYASEILHSSAVQKAELRLE